jgi:hypothetical protein
MEGFSETGNFQFEFLKAWAQFRENLRQRNKMKKNPPILIETFHLFRGKFNILKMYLHRYLRTTPVLGILILIIVSILKHMGDGPYFQFISNEALIGQCEKYWWSALLHIQNYYNPMEAVKVTIDLRWKLKFNQKVFQCLQASWYLSADFQLVTRQKHLKWACELIKHFFKGFNFPAFDVPDLQIWMEISLDAADIRGRCWIVDVHRCIPEWIQSREASYVSFSKKETKFHELNFHFSVAGWLTLASHMQSSSISQHTFDAALG